MASRSVFPSTDELNAASVTAFGESVALLFEPTTRFAAWLAAARPFESDDELLAAAARIAHQMSEADQLELVSAHPRLGARDRLSRASHREQGAPDDPADAELARLNRKYESRFGFRYLVFVNGRSRAELLPELKVRLTNSRPTELRRALDDTLAIAADRLHWFRTNPAEDR